MPGTPILTIFPFSRIDVPTPVIHGDADRIVPIKAAGEKTAKLVKGARLASTKDGPHALNWTHAEEVNTELVSLPAVGIVDGKERRRPEVIDWLRLSLSASAADP